MSIRKSGLKVAISTLIYKIIVDRATYVGNINLILKLGPFYLYYISYGIYQHLKNEII